MRKFSFFPNRFVTLKMFKNIRSFQSKSLIYGSPGVSKTTSAILYSCLNYVINSYEFEYDEIIAPKL